MEPVVDDDLVGFEAAGAAPLPPSAGQRVTHDGATHGTSTLMTLPDRGFNLDVTKFSETAD
jgi:hypothetical protein